MLVASSRLSEGQGVELTRDINAFLACRPCAQPPGGNSEAQNVLSFLHHQV